MEQSLDRCTNPKAEIRRLIKGGDYLSACQLIKSRLGPASWHDVLEHFFLNPNYAPDDIHQTIFDLDLPIVATTNIDSIYDRFLSANYNAATIIKPYHDDSIGRYVKGDASTRLVIKVHGSVDNLEGTVFTRQEYANARSKHAGFYDLLSSLISTQTFLFLGYSLADPDINLILEDNARRFKSPRPHYLLTSDRATPDMVRLFEENYSIKILQYSPLKDHEELVSSLRGLASSAASARSHMAASLIW
ncbi:SIR2 family NAD-dependent protein deacylase [Sphingomonas sp. HMP6]|uniref:SIR2 family NAD-dependent protein deacylase n=1 Tax=Sphingomonas sp. HMP6 TaxID=1517551 RepID=UPI0015966B30|nr:SIR2 family protein [Sphingomonas sp. HMP6]